MAEIEKYIPDNKITSDINKMYKTQLDRGIVKDILRDLNIRPINGEDSAPKIYRYNDIKPYIDNGTLRRLALRYNKLWTEKPPVSTPIKQPYKREEPREYDVLKRNGRHFFIKNEPNKQKEKDEASYKNGENDMEEYSNYLINNTYQNESLIRKIVKESLDRILK